MSDQLSESEMEAWRKSFGGYRVFEKKKIPSIFLGIPLLLWTDIILPMLLAPKGSCDSCTFAMGRKNYFSLRLVCWQFLSMVGGDDELWKKVVSRALGRDSLRAWGEVFWDEKQDFIRKRALHSIGSAFLDSNFDKSTISVSCSDLVYDTLIARKKAINKWLLEKSKWELIALFAVYRPVLTVKIEQGINLSEDYVPLPCYSSKGERDGDYGSSPFTLHFLNTVPGNICYAYRGDVNDSVPEDDFFQEGRIMNVLMENCVEDSCVLKKKSTGGLILDEIMPGMVEISNEGKDFCKECLCFKGRDFPVFCNLDLKNGTAELKFKNWSTVVDQNRNELIAMIEIREFEMKYNTESYFKLVPKELLLKVNTDRYNRESRFSSNVIKLNFM